jgi:monoamine oxidase
MRTVERFDDGDRRVPGGLEGTVERVVVVGAGIAGLTIGNALAHADVPCVLLEARDRIGGRVHTVDLGGWPIDLGASWIHSPVGNPLSRLADLAGIPRRAGDPLLEMVGLDRHEGRVLPAAEFAEVLRAVDEFSGASGALERDLGPGATVAEGIERFTTGRASSGGARWLRDALTSIVEIDSSAPPEVQTLASYPANALDYGGDYLGDLPVGGYRRVARALGAGLDVRVGADVEQVIVRPEGVRVRTVSGADEEGSHVVVTVPLGVLQGGGLRFDPPLPPERVATIGRLGFGRYEKVAMRFEEPFWRAAGVPHLLVFPAGADGLAPFLAGQDAFDGGPVLVAHAGGRSADRMNALSDSEVVARLRELMSEAAGGPVPEPAAVLRTSWVTDPHSRGSYAYIPIGASRRDLDALGEPIGGRLLFAGEATSSARAGFVDGAMTTGIREAKRLLGAPDLVLGLRP